MRRVAKLLEPPMTTDPYPQLRELKQLRDQGLLTEAEFQLRRQELLQRAEPLFADTPSTDSTPDRTRTAPSWLLWLALPVLLLLGGAVWMASRTPPSPPPTHTQTPETEPTPVVSQPQDSTPTPAEELRDDLDALADMLRDALEQLEEARTALEDASDEADRSAQAAAYRDAVENVMDNIDDVEEAIARVPLDDEAYAPIDELLEAATVARASDDRVGIQPLH